MKKALLIALSAATLAFGVQPAALANDYGTITVKGYAQERYQATQAMVTVTNLVEKDTLAEAKAENDKRATKFRESLRSIGIADKEIRTSNYTISDRHYRIKDTEEYRTTYVVSNTLEVTVNDVKKTSLVIDHAAAAGINDVRLAKLDLPEAEKAIQLQELTVKASKDARQKAEAIAAALGTKIIGVESMNVGGYYNDYRAMKLMAVGAGAEYSEPSSAIEVGEDKEDMQVTVVFKIK